MIRWNLLLSVLSCIFVSFKLIRHESDVCLLDGIPLSWPCLPCLPSWWICFYGNNKFKILCYFFPGSLGQASKPCLLCVRIEFVINVDITTFYYWPTWLILCICWRKKNIHSCKKYEHPHTTSFQKMSKVRPILRLYKNLCAPFFRFFAGMGQKKPGPEN